MRYQEFERIISQKRLRRYVAACGGNTRKALTLYRYLQDPVICTTHVLGIYSKMQTLFAWMGIDCQDLLYGLDHVRQVCTRINELKE